MDARSFAERLYSFLHFLSYHVCRRRRGFGPLAQAGYQPLDGCTEGMTPEQMRALPIVIAEKRGRRSGSDGEGVSHAFARA